MDKLSDFTRFDFAHGGTTKRVYRKGDGPAVLVMHEVPGVTAEVARFARNVVSAGMTVFLPRLFGRVGPKTNQAERMLQLGRLCVSREFACLAENRASPITEWLRGLAKHAYDEVGGRGVGVVGMCVTGNFALTMTLDPWVIAPVLGHPSFPLPITRAKAAAVHATPEAMNNARRRIDEEGLRFLGVRFHGDTVFCRPARFRTLRTEFGDGFEAIELPAESANPAPEPPHSVLTIGLVDRQGELTRAAVDRVLQFLGERLKPE